MEALQPHLAMMKKYLCEVLPPCQPLPPAPQSSTLTAQGDEVVAKMQENAFTCALSERDLGPLRTDGDIGPRDPNKVTGRAPEHRRRHPSLVTPTKLGSRLSVPKSL